MQYPQYKFLELNQAGHGYYAKVFLCIVTIFLFAASICIAKIDIELSGDRKQGYTVNILYGGKPIANHCGGEFTVTVENADHSYQQTIRDWKATSYQKQPGLIKLSGCTALGDLIAHLNVDVTYRVINEYVVKKEITLSQNNARKLFHSLENRLCPLAPVKNFWSFEQEDCEGGSLLEVYPAAGFRLENDLAVGLLTDAGHRNLWTRNVRKRNVTGPFDRSGFTAIKIMPDKDLVTVSKEDKYAALTFGKLHNFTCGRKQQLTISPLNKWKALSDANVKQLTADLIGISGKCEKKNLGGASVPLVLTPGFLYNISFEYRSDAATLSTRLRNEHGRDMGLYNDRLTSEPNEWHSFAQEYFVPDKTGYSCQYELIISRGYFEETSPYTLEIKDFMVSQISPLKQCYHPLESNKPLTKTVFIFAQPAKNLRDYRIASQVRLAEALGFKGSIEEKIFYADLMMLTWINGPHDLTAHVVPSLSYSPDMYNRDSFWCLMGCYDKKLSEAIWQKWADTQDKDGCIGTIITPCVGSEENTPNDATMCFIIWAYVNKTRYHSNIDLIKVRRALNFCREAFELDEKGRRLATTPTCQMDVMWSPEEGRIYAVNQGMFAVILRCAEELGCDVSMREIKQAQQAYKMCYDKKRKHLLSWPDRPDIIALYDFVPEFLSLWLWDEPILSSEAVVNTLEKFPVYEDCSPIMCKCDGSFFTEDDHPFDQPDLRWQAGMYYNGGSWLRVEYMAYVAGLKHGWEKAGDRMSKRLHAEFNRRENEPFSHEYLPCVENDEWNMAKVFAWNSFILVANEVAGLRHPRQYPCFGK